MRYSGRLLISCFRRYFAETKALQQKKKLRCSSIRPETFRLDGESLKPDDKWNLSPAVLQLLERRLLNEADNPMSLLKNRIINYMNHNFRCRGGHSPLFTVLESQPRVVSVFDNFDSLLVPSEHPSRSELDTYYINNDYCLRAHTSAHQHSIIKQGLDNFLVIGDVYRRDTIDRSHFPCFHQMEGVRLFTPAELFVDPYNPNPNSILEDGVRTDCKQQAHTLEAAEAVTKDLKNSLEALCGHIFGNDCQMRWVTAEFPFTHPSFELEILYEGSWMEILGCGVVEQQVLESAGVVDKIGWAFGIGLDRLAMILYGIPDIRMLWSRDSGFLSQFAGKNPMDNFKYIPLSIHPQVIFDLSFWLPEGLNANEMSAETFDHIRSVGGGLIEQVKIIDTFIHQETRRTSQTYRLIYRSHERALSKDEANAIHTEIKISLVQKYGVTLRC